MCNDFRLQSGCGLWPRRYCSPVASDAQNNPIVIADVRATKFQKYLHRTANVKNSIAALATRIESGLILAHRTKCAPNPAGCVLSGILHLVSGEHSKTTSAGFPSGAKDFFEALCFLSPGNGVVWQSRLCCCDEKPRCVSAEHCTGNRKVKRHIIARCFAAQIAFVWWRGKEF